MSKGFMPSPLASVDGSNRPRYGNDSAMIGSPHKSMDYAGILSAGQLVMTATASRRIKRNVQLALRASLPSGRSIPLF